MPEHAAQRPNSKQEFHNSAATKFHFTATGSLMMASCVQQRLAAKVPSAIESPSGSVARPILQRWRPPDRSRSQYKGHDNNRVRTCPRQSHTTETRKPFDALVMAATNNDQEQTKPQPGREEKHSRTISSHIQQLIVLLLGSAMHLI